MLLGNTTEPALPPFSRRHAEDEHSNECLVLRSLPEAQRCSREGDGHRGDVSNQQSVRSFVSLARPASPTRVWLTGSLPQLSKTGNAVRRWAAAPKAGSRGEMKEKG